MYTVYGYYSVRDFEPSCSRSFKSEKSALNYKDKLDNSGAYAYVKIVKEY